MKKITAILAIFLAVSYASAQNNIWLSDFENAQKLSIATNKLIFIDFYASWCGPCKRMEKEAFADPEIKEILNNYVLLRLDFDREVALRNKYGVRAIPYIFVTDSQGHIINGQKGYSGKNAVREFLDAYNLNLSYLQRENAQFYENENYVTAMRLAQKYLDFSLFLDRNIKSDFLKIADIYLSKAEEALEKKQSNYKVMSQKIELYELTSVLYNGRFKKLERGLKKMEENSIHELNQDAFNFLNYCLAYQNNEKEELQKWETAVLNSTSAELYMKKKNELFKL